MSQESDQVNDTFNFYFYAQSFFVNSEQNFSEITEETELKVLENVYFADVDIDKSKYHQHFSLLIDWCDSDAVVHH